MAQNLDKGNLYQAAKRANLNPAQMQQINSLSEMYSTHTRLSGLPQNIAQEEFSQLDPNKQKTMAAFLGTKEGETPERSLIGQAAYIVSRPIVEPIKAVFKAANWLSDQTTRAYRTGAIAIDQNVNLVDAWQKSGAKGEQVFSPDRIQKATKMYGADRVAIAKKIAGGIPLDQIIAEAENENQKRIAAEGAQNKDSLLNEAIAKVNAAKYSPGRQLANAFLPQDLEGGSAIYSWLSGIGDATYRIGLDPTLWLGKANKIYQASQYALKNTVGSSGKVADAFNTSTVRGKNINRFWEEYTANVNELRKARTGDALKVGEITGRLRRLSPGMMDANVPETLLKYADDNYNGVLNVTTVKNFLTDAENITPLFYGQPGYFVKVMPKLSATRKKRLDFYNKVSNKFDLNKDSASFLRNIAFDEADLQGISTQEAVITSLTGRAGESVKDAAARTAARLSDEDAAKKIFTSRWSLGAINQRLDRVSAKFARIPEFKYLGDFENDRSIRATGQMARMIYGRYGARIIEDAYRVANPAQRRDMFIGLQTTMGTVRGLPATPGGRKLLETLGSLNRDAVYTNPVFDIQTGQYRIPSIDVTGVDSAVYPYQAAERMRPITLDEMDKHAAREGFIGKTMGLQYGKIADDSVDGWAALTLLGPRFPIRNAIEDFAFDLANSGSVKGLIRGRRTATKIRAVSKELELGIINRFAKKGKVEEITKQFDEVSNGTYKLANGNFATTPSQKELAKRQILAKTLIDNKFDDAVKGQFGSDYDRFLYEFATYGDFENVLREVSEGAYNFALGGGAKGAATRAQRNSKGKVVDYTFDGEAYRRNYNSTFRVASIDSKSLVGWAFQVGVKSRDELGSQGLLLLSKHLDDRQSFIAELAPVINSKKFEKLRNTLIRYNDPNYTAEMHAGVVYDDLRAMVSKRDGSINQQFLAKIVKKDPNGVDYVDPDGVKSIHDFPTAPEDIPMGLTVPEFIPVAQSGNYISDFIRRSWDWAGAANARISRDALGMDAAFNIRKELQPYLNDLENKFLASGMSADKARAAATKRVVDLSQDLAVERVSNFVDNPEIRSQLAWSARNFARFYRATEDAYRRLYRTVKYNPEGIRKIALTYEGVTHAGFVQRDDQGEPYFVYPGVAPVYNAVNKALNIFGLGDYFVTPMPLQFGASIKMLTPSADPDSWIPALSGPLSALPMKAIYSIAGVMKESDLPLISRIGGELKATEKYVLGSYSEDQSMVNAMLPGHVNRLISALDRDERDSQYASAFRKAVTYLEAAGMTPSADATPGEKQQYQDRLRTTIAGILGVRFVLGFAAPASPSIQLKSEMADWVQNNSRANFKQVYLNLINQYEDEPDPVGRAMEDWVRYFPEQLPFTVSESDPRVNARFKTSQEAASWVEDNKELLRKYPEGAAYLMPQTGEFTFDAYKALKAEGFRENKLVGDFLQEVFVARSKQYYYEQRDVYEEQLSKAVTDGERKLLKQKWDGWSKEYTNTRPLLQLEFAESASNSLKRIQSYADLKRMLQSENINTPAAKALREMVQAYDEYEYYSSTVYNSRSEDDLRAREALKESTLLQLRQIAAKDPNASSAYDVLFAQFLRD